MLTNVNSFGATDDQTKWNAATDKSNDDHHSPEWSSHNVHLEILLRSCVTSD